MKVLISVLSFFMVVGTFGHKGLNVSSKKIFDELLKGYGNLKLTRQDFPDLPVITCPPDNDKCYDKLDALIPEMEKCGITNPMDTIEQFCKEMCKQGDCMKGIMNSIQDCPKVVQCFDKFVDDLTDFYNEEVCMDHKCNSGTSLNASCLAIISLLVISIFK